MCSTSTSTSQRRSAVFFGSWVLVLCMCSSGALQALSPAVRLAAASRAMETTPASKLLLWQLGLFRSPSSEYEATVQPPAQTGMKAQSWHSFHADSCSNFRAAAERYGSVLPAMWPVDIFLSPVKPGQA